MSAQSVARQVEELKTRVTALEQLPARFDALEGQISHMLVEIRAEFSAVRGEMRTGFAQVREEIRAGDEQTRVHTRLLHEETLSRLALIDEGRPRRRKRR